MKMCKKIRKLFRIKRSALEAAHAHLHDVRRALLASGSDPTEQKCDDGLVLYSILLLSSAYSMPSPLFREV